jgi:hypothetical protein
MGNLKENIKKNISENRFFAPVYFYLTLPYFTFKFKKLLKENLVFDQNNSESLSWQKRIEEVIVCNDNYHIKRYENAGKIIANRLIMHNGIKVHPLSYYGKFMLKMLMDNKGVHEPQEEKAFQEVLKEIPEKGTMLELGSYWAFYSLWFHKQVKDAKNYMIDPNPICLQSGKLNFRINKFKGTFLNGYIGNSYIKAAVPTFSVDYLIKNLDLKHVHIVHSDIQGYEIDMLNGCEESIKSNKISYFFISTHSDEIHDICLNILKEREFCILASANCSQSFSVDGIIVAKASFVSKPEKINISLKK